MKHQEKMTLIGYAVFFGLAVLASIPLCLLMAWRFVVPYLGKPTGYLPPTYTVRLARAALYRNAGLTGAISDVQFDRFNPGKGEEIGIAGERGAVFLDRQARVQSAVRFTHAQINTRVIDFKHDSSYIDDKVAIWAEYQPHIICLNHDGCCEYYDNNSYESLVLDHHGKINWMVSTPSINYMAVGDLNGDGQDEFVLSLSGNKGLRVLNSRGKELWRLSCDDVNSVNLIDARQRGRLDILLSRKRYSQLTVIDAQTRRSRDSYLPIAPDEISKSTFCRWPAADSPLHVLSIGDDVMSCFTIDGKVMKQYYFPKRYSPVERIYATPVILEPGQQPYFAVLADWINDTSDDASVLLIYDSNGMPVYQQELGSECRALTTLPAQGGRGEELLVGCTDAVWRYTFAGKKPV